MATTCDYIRDVNVENEKVRKDFKITDFKVIETIEDMYYWDQKLHSFKMNNETYIEYIREFYCWNGNTFIYFIWYRKENEQPKVIHSYEMTTFECPKCKSTYVETEDQVNYTCRGCKYVWHEKEFNDMYYCCPSCWNYKMEDWKDWKTKKCKKCRKEFPENDCCTN